MKGYENETRELIEFAKTVLELVNAEREKEGLTALESSELLHAVATIRATELAERFSHQRPDGLAWYTVLDEFAVPYDDADENIGNLYASPGQAVEDWMNTPKFRENIMNPKFNMVGVGLHLHNNGTVCGVLLFIEHRN